MTEEEKPWWKIVSPDVRPSEQAQTAGDSLAVLLHSRQFELTAPDAQGVRRFARSDAELFGEFSPLPASAMLPDGTIQIPDDGIESIAFPTVEGPVRYVGPLPRGACMFAMHKTVRLMPATLDLARMIATFDRHDELDSSWMFRELAIEDFLGKDCLKFVESVAIERGLARRGRDGVVRRTNRPYVRPR